MHKFTFPIYTDIWVLNIQSVMWFDAFLSIFYNDVTNFKRDKESYNCQKTWEEINLIIQSALWVMIKFICCVYNMGYLLMHIHDVYKHTYIDIK